MFEEIFHSVIMVLIDIFECFGALVLALSVFKAFYHWVRKQLGRDADYHVGLTLLKGMSTALQFKMAAEILKTSIVGDMNELLVLGAVVALRAVMSLLIHFEMKDIEKH